MAREKQRISSACGARHQPPPAHYVHTPSQQGQHLGLVTCMASGASACACSPRATTTIPPYAAEKLHARVRHGQHPHHPTTDAGHLQAEGLSSAPWRSGVERGGWRAEAGGERAW